jgi:Protein of unknown function (DUF2656)
LGNWVDLLGKNSLSRKIMVSDTLTGRMLLSHNFNIAADRMPPLSRAEFGAVFTDGFQPLNQVTCQPIEHPHWQVEVQFDPHEYSPPQIGQQIAQFFALKRQQQMGTATMPAILILGGLKTTPATGPLPALQPGEWGVDVVETESVVTFLQAIGWDATVSQRSPDTIFKIESTA